MSEEQQAIVRKAIKVRKPIQQEFCACHNIQVLATNGMPELCIADKLSTEELQKLLDTASIMIPVGFLDGVSPVSQKNIRMCLERNLPVTIRTKGKIPESLLDALSKVPRSSVQTHIEFIDPFVRNRMDRTAAEPKSLLEGMHLMKSKKIFQSLNIVWHPYFDSMFSVFEIVDMFKNYISHVMVTFYELTDQEYKSYIDVWEGVFNVTASHFKHFYAPDVRSRSWQIKDKHKQGFLSCLGDFLKGKRLTLEVMEREGEGRIRHSHNGTSACALGIDPMFYVRCEDGMYQPAKDIQEEPCIKCGKNIFCV